jgi:SpoVK/Ycf46/Vps4 family AAA+-type ATPase
MHPVFDPWWLTLTKHGFNSRQPPAALQARQFGASTSPPNTISDRPYFTRRPRLSERRKPVFIVATANDIERLPPEMVRKGRFDEIFFVDLPSPQNRREILDIHLRKRCLDPARFDLRALSAATDGFSGSEIEQAIVSSMYTVLALGRELSQADLLAEIKQTRPLSVLMSEKVQEIRDWAAERTVPCD